MPKWILFLIGALCLVTQAVAQQGIVSPHNFLS